MTEILQNVTRNNIDSSDSGIHNMLSPGGSCDIRKRTRKFGTSSGEKLKASRPPLEAKKAGPYLIGPLVKKFIHSPFTRCLARKEGTDQHYLMKVLVLNDELLNDMFALQRRTLFHTEYTILSLLKDSPGVVQLHDFFKDNVYEQKEGGGSGVKLKRMCMVLECCIPHENHNPELVTLTSYIKEKKKLEEPEALAIMHSVLEVIADLHRRNIVHKDLKLTNIILNRRTLKVKLVNFYYAKLLHSDDEVMHDQRGTPSYTPPDIIMGKAFSPKPCDMWALGVIFYTMVHGHLPFTTTTHTTPVAFGYLAELYAKIIRLDYVISTDIKISEGTRKLIKSLLCQHPTHRMSADQALAFVTSGLFSHMSSHLLSLKETRDSRIVPDNPAFEEKSEEPETPNRLECLLVVHGDECQKKSTTYRIAITEMDSPEGKRRRVSPGLQLERSEELEPDKDSVLQRTNKTNKTNMSNISDAMVRLGATSIIPIHALSFNYRRKDARASAV